MVLTQTCCRTLNRFWLFQSSKPKFSRGKKKQQIPSKKRPRSQSSDGTSEAEEKVPAPGLNLELEPGSNGELCCLFQPKKKKVAGAKTKKADSSSSSKNTNPGEPQVQNLNRVRPGSGSDPCVC